MNKQIINIIKLLIIWIIYIIFLKYFLYTEKIKNYLGIMEIQISLSIFWVLILIHYCRKLWIKSILKYIMYIPLLLIIIVLLYYYFFRSINVLYFNIIKNPIIIVSLSIIVYLLYFNLMIYILNKFLYIKNSNNWFLISDKPIDNKDGDELWYEDKAKSFTKTIWNNWDTEWFVFWLIAPWGVWKSSFLKFVKKEIKSNNIYKWNVEILEFHPWYYETENVLFDQFLEELKNFLKSITDLYIPDLENDMEQLLSLLQDKTNNFLWVKFSFIWNKTFVDLKSSIEESLKKIDKKVIIIIDDLDRISSEKLKKIFMIADLCRWFHNTNFVFCYDLQNFNNIDETLKETKSVNWDNFSVSTENVDNRNLIRYIEKIVNVQYSLYPNFDKFKEYFSKIFIKWELKFSVNSEKWIKKWIDRLFEAKEFRIWWKYLSDIRSIKRLYNDILAICISDDNNTGQKRKFYLEVIFDENQWIFFDKFIQLWILKLSHNDLFLDIYNETYLSSNYESILEYSWDTNIFTFERKYENWSYFYYSKDVLLKYIERLNLEKQSYISDLFKLIQKKERVKSIENVDRRDIRLSDNLKKYLNLINMDFWNFDDDIIYYNFIEGMLKKFKSNELALSGIIEEIENKYNEKWIKDFINKVINNIYWWENDKDKSIELVNFIIDNFYKYSLNGVIDWLYSDIIQILNNWAQFNNDSDLTYISDFVYWTWKYKWNWILDRLFNDNWWVLWIEVAIWIFHKLNSNNNEYYTFRKAVVENEELNKHNKFYSAKIARYIYNHFKEKYIKNQWRNIFKEIKNLSSDKFKNKNSRNNWHYNRNNFWIFLIYQLTEEIWYFDDYDDTSKINEYENQNWWIKKELNKYYFEYCFNWDDIKYFMHYFTYFVSENVGSRKVQIDKIKIEQDYDYKKWKVFDYDLLKKFVLSRYDDIEKFINEHWLEESYSFISYQGDDESKSVIFYNDFTKLFKKIKDEK